MKSSERPEVKDLKLPTILMTNQWLCHGNRQKNMWRGNHKQCGALKEHNWEKNGNYMMFSLFCAGTAMYSLILNSGKSEIFQEGPVRDGERSWCWKQAAERFHLKGEMFGQEQVQFCWFFVVVVLRGGEGQECWCFEIFMPGFSFGREGEFCCSHGPAAIFFLTGRCEALMGELFQMQDAVLPSRNLLLLPEEWS